MKRDPCSLTPECPKCSRDTGDTLSTNALLWRRTRCRSSLTFRPVDILEPRRSQICVPPDSKDTETRRNGRNRDSDLDRARKVFWIASPLSERHKMSVPQRYLARRPPWVLPALGALCVASGSVALEYGRLMDSGGIWAALDSRRRELAPSTGIAQLDRVLAALSLAAFPPTLLPSEDGQCD